MMGFGFVVARFGLFLQELARMGEGRLPSTGWSLWIGTGLVVLGVGVNLLAAYEHSRFLRRFRRGESQPPPAWSLQPRDR